MERELEIEDKEEDEGEKFKKFLEAEEEKMKRFQKKLHDEEEFEFKES